MNRRRAHRAGNQREIFEAGQALRQGPRNEFVPVLTRTGFYKNGVMIFANHAAPAQFDEQRDTLEIARQHDVAAAAEHQLPQCA